MKPFRVAQIIGKICAGGVESVIFNYYRHLDHNKIQFDFYYDADSTVSPPQELIDMGARFVQIPPYQKLWEYIPALIGHFKENRYRIVHSHLNSLSVFSLFAAWVADVPVRIAHSHSVPGGNEAGRNLLKECLKYFSKWFATDYFACSEIAGRWLFGEKCFHTREVTIINNAIDMKRFQRQQSTVVAVRKALSLENDFVIGHVGRLTYAKNHKFLIEVFSEIKKRIPNAILLLVGDGELREELSDYLASKELSDSVRFTGSVSNPEWYYHAFDVFVFPSHYEGLGMVVIEAQVAGVPCVVSTAVPDEVKISDGVLFVDLTDGADSWAKLAISFQGKRATLLEKSSEYDLKNNVYKLQQWYVNEMEKLNTNGRSAHSGKTVN